MTFATPAYLKAVQKKEYYFNCEELLWLAECAESNVIVAKSEGDYFRVEGPEFGGDRPVAVISLQGGGQRRVRGHYERLCPQSWIDEGRAIALAIEEKAAAAAAKENQEKARSRGLADNAASENLKKQEQEHPLAMSSKLGSFSADGMSPNKERDASARPTDTVDVERHVQRRAEDPGFRGEEECKDLLRCEKGYAVQHTTAHGENNCLIEAILCALHSEGYLSPMRRRKRQRICSAARAHLIAHHGVANEGCPYLAHDEHFDPICNYLRSNVPEIWRYVTRHDFSDVLETSLLTITVQVFSRSQARDEVDEIKETEPICSLAPLAEYCSTEVEEVEIYLYCNTHDNGEGWHYEWIRPESAEAEPGDYDAIADIEDPP